MVCGQVYTQNCQPQRFVYSFSIDNIYSYMDSPSCLLFINLSWLFPKQRLFCFILKTGVKELFSFLFSLLTFLDFSISLTLFLGFLFVVKRTTICIWGWQVRPWFAGVHIGTYPGALIVPNLTFLSADLPCIWTAVQATQRL